MRTTPMRANLVARFGAVAVAGMLLAACGGGETGGGSGAGDYSSYSGGSDNNSSSGAGGDYGSDSGSKDAAAGGAIKVADSDFGPILTDAEGRALYGFSKDTKGRSTCYGNCEQAWPPLLAEGAPTASGDLDESLLKTVTREDGSKQVVVGKWPAYLFASDSAAGDTNGQGVNDVWWLISPDGKLIKNQ
jgi:predicted lipoprotein with Yx(FWY)xxD motif